jgi:hypothetical protein
VQTTTGLSGPEAPASSFANSAGVTESVPHGHPEDAEPEGSPEQAAAMNTAATIDAANVQLRLIAGKPRGSSR